jgi:hypothetical protein
VVNLPPVLNFFFKGISPFLDPVTRDKVHSSCRSSSLSPHSSATAKMRFNPNLLELVHPLQLDSDFGDDLVYDLEKDSYWEQIVRCVVLLIFCDGSTDPPARACGIAEDGTKIHPPDEKVET